MSIAFNDLQAQYKAYRNEINAELQQQLETGQFIGGPQIDQLESALASFTAATFAIGCSSGTDALLLALMAIDIKPGDEVITTSFTFVSTAETIALLGATPVFVDVDEHTFNIDDTLIEQKITPKTKAIIAVSLFGQPANLESINLIAESYNLIVIEDAAQSFGATHHSRKSCNLSTIGVTSFFPAKPLGCYGDGGAVFTNDQCLANRIKRLLNHGQSEKYHYEEIGINGRLDSIQAAILRIKLHHYPDEIKNRNSIAARYNQNLKGVITPIIENHNTSVWAQYCIKASNRTKYIAKCKEHGIPTAIYYPIPLHHQKPFKKLIPSNPNLPVTDYLSSTIFALPMSAFLTTRDQEFIIDIINKT